MSREIKFRGLNAQCEMVYGDLRHDLPNSTAYYDEYPARICWHEDQASCNQPIKKGTEGQYTGLKDVNGVEIYEGDIVHWGHIDGYKECVPRKAVVEFSPEMAFMTFNLKHNHRFGFSNFIYTNTHKAMEVIGNIHQNADLIAKAEGE